MTDQWQWRRNDLLSHVWGIRNSATPLTLSTPSCLGFPVDISRRRQLHSKLKRLIRSVSSHRPCCWPTLFFPSNRREADCSLPPSFFFLFAHVIFYWWDLPSPSAATKGCSTSRQLPPLNRDGNSASACCCCCCCCWGSFIPLLPPFLFYQPSEPLRIRYFLYRLQIPIQFSFVFLIKRKFPDAAVIDWPIRIITGLKGGSEMHLATPRISL